MNAGIIWLSVRHFDDGLLIEVFDTDANPPVYADESWDAESGRGLFIVDALSKYWSYFFPPDGGKVVYCFIRALLRPMQHSAVSGKGLNLPDVVVSES